MSFSGDGLSFRNYVNSNYQTAVNHKSAEFELPSLLNIGLAYDILYLRHRLTGSEYTLRIEAIKDGYRSQISPSFGLMNPVIQTPDGTGVVSGN